MSIIETIKKFCVKHPKLAHVGWTWSLPTFSKKNEPDDKINGECPYCKSKDIGFIGNGCGPDGCQWDYICFICNRSFYTYHKPLGYKEKNVITHYCWCGHCHWDPPTCCQK